MSPNPAILIESRMLNGVVERRPIMLCSGHTPLLDLPYEIFLLIFAHMDADGIMNLLSTCHSLYSHFKDEPIWRELCTRYGVVDLSHFPHQSFFAVYASLLYTFGPLLGLWASDHPFSGNVIEFRMVEEPNLGPVILGEVWRFQSHVVNASDPKLPEYLEFVRIRPTWNESGLPGLAELYWYVREEKPTEVPSLALLASTQYSTFLRYRDYITGDINLAPHPDFPSSSALWYDRTRPLPRLEQVPCGDFRNEEIPEDTDDALLMFPGGEMKPPALAFLPTTAKDVSYLHHPLLTIPDLRISHHEQGEPVAPTPSRYYPLRFPVPHKHLYRDPGDGDWSRECLDGLWIGANGAHDSEVLLVDSSDRKETKAWKVTGTMHIPRGETCWKFNPDDTVALSSISSELEFGDVPSTSRVFTGSGHICPEGFMYVQHLTIFGFGFVADPYLTCVVVLEKIVGLIL